MVRMEKAKAEALGRQCELTDFLNQFDFIFERSDGLSFTLHPKHDAKNKKVPVKVKTENEEPVPAPTGGIFQPTGQEHFNEAITGIRPSTSNSEGPLVSPQWRAPINLLAVADIRSGGRPQ